MMGGLINRACAIRGGFSRRQAPFPQKGRPPSRPVPNQRCDATGESAFTKLMKLMLSSPAPPCCDEHHRQAIRTVLF